MSKLRYSDNGLVLEYNESKVYNNTDTANNNLKSEWLKLIFRTIFSSTVVYAFLQILILLLLGVRTKIFSTFMLLNIFIIPVSLIIGIIFALIAVTVNEKSRISVQNLAILERYANMALIFSTIAVLIDYIGYIVTNVEPLTHVVPIIFFMFIGAMPSLLLVTELLDDNRELYKYSNETINAKTIMKKLKLTGKYKLNNEQKSILDELNQIVICNSNQSHNTDEHYTIKKLHQFITVKQSQPEKIVFNIDTDNCILYNNITERNEFEKLLSEEDKAIVHEYSKSISDWDIALLLKYLKTIDATNNYHASQYKQESFKRAKEKFDVDIFDTLILDELRNVTDTK